MYKWQNNFTGEVFKTLTQAVFTAVEDMVHFPKCRTIKIFDFSKIK